MTEKTLTRCVACAGKGWRWSRGRTGEARMVKRNCAVCQGKGRVRVKPGADT